jgi:flagellar assembly factor FliW
MVTVYNVEAKDYIKQDIEEVFTYLRPYLENPTLFGKMPVIEDFELFDLEFEGGSKTKYLMSINSFN